MHQLNGTVENIPHKIPT